MKEVNRKSKNQASRVVIDLNKSDSTLTQLDIENAIYKGDITTGVSVTKDGKKYLQYTEEIIVIDKNGNVNTIYPP